MDQKLVSLCKKHGVYYTRYSEDITFSVRKRRTLPGEIASVLRGGEVILGAELERIVRDEAQFRFNVRKIRAADRSRRLAVTGLTVNRFPNVQRRYIDSTRGMINAWKKYGIDQAQKRYHDQFDSYGERAEFRRVVAGRLAFIRSVRGVDDRVFRRLHDRARDLDPALFPELPPLTSRASSLEEAARELPAITASDSATLRRQYFHRMLTSAQGALWIVDPFLTARTIEELVAPINDLQVHTVRLLSRAVPRGGDRHRFEAVQGALQARGIMVEWRGIRMTPPLHDRGIGDDRHWITFSGPLDGLHKDKPSYSQVHVSQPPLDLDTWWLRATT